MVLVWVRGMDAMNALNGGVIGLGFQIGRQLTL